MAAGRWFGCDYDSLAREKLDVVDKELVPILVIEHEEEIERTKAIMRACGARVS